MAACSEPELPEQDLTPPPLPESTIVDLFLDMHIAEALEAVQRSKRLNQENKEKSANKSSSSSSKSPKKPIKKSSSALKSKTSKGKYIESEKIDDGNVPYYYNVKEVYAYIYEKYGLDKEKLEEIFVFYADHPEQFKEVYKKVDAKIDKMKLQVK